MTGARPVLSFHGKQRKSLNLLTQISITNIPPAELRFRSIVFCSVPVQPYWTRLRACTGLEGRTARPKKGDDHVEEENSGTPHGCGDGWERDTAGSGAKLRPRL